MNPTTRGVRVAALLAAGCGPSRAEGDGFVPLFNGKDLDGWQAAPWSLWTAEGGVIALPHREDGNEHNGDYLWTKEVYGDSILELEFRIPAQANSGVFLRVKRL